MWEYEVLRLSYKGARRRTRRRYGQHSDEKIGNLLVEFPVNGRMGAIIPTWIRWSAKTKTLTIQTEDGATHFLKKVS